MGIVCSSFLAFVAGGSVAPVARVRVDAKVSGGWSLAIGRTGRVAAWPRISTVKSDLVVGQYA